MKRQYTMKLVEAIRNITEEKTLPAASSDAAGIVEEAAAKTTPPVESFHPVLVLLLIGILEGK